LKAGGRPALSAAATAYRLLDCLRVDIVSPNVIKAGFYVVLFAP